MQPSPRSNPRTFLSVPKQFPDPWAVPYIRPSSSPWQWLIYFLPVRVCLFWTFAKIEPYSMWHSVPGFFHIAKRCQHLSTLYQISVLPSFLLLDNIPLCGWSTFYLCVHQWMDVWTGSTFWPLYIILPSLFMYKFLCEHNFFFFYFPGWIFWGTVSLFFDVSPLFNNPTSIYYCYFIIAILGKVKWQLIEILVCISLMINGIEHIFICSGGMSIQIHGPFFNWDICLFIIFIVMSSL